MAIGWMTILSNVPWSDVIKNAPAVADGAKKLWKKIGSKSAADPGTPDASPEAQLATLQARVEELHAQMQAASEVIRSLAEQNAQLIARVEKSRRRLYWLGGFNLVTLMLVAALYF